MAKKRKPRKRKRKETRKGPIYFKLQNPFEHIQEDNMPEVRAEIANFYDNQFQEVLERLEQIAGTQMAICLLVCLSTSNLFLGVSDSGELSESWHSPSVSQAGVELFQALILKNAGNNVEEKLDLPTALEQVYDLLPMIILAFSLKRTATTINDEEIKHTMFLQEQLRLHTLVIRNWGYYQQSLSILRKLYSPLDISFAKAGLLTATEIIGLFEYLVKKAETGVTDHEAKLQRILKSKSVEAAVSAYHEAFAMAEGSAVKFLSYCREKHFGRDEVKHILSMHSLAILHDVFMSTCSEISAIVGRDESTVSKTLGRFCINLGELADHNAEYLFLDNPIWTRPLIPMDENTIFCPMPQLFTGFAFAAMNSLCGEDNRLLKAIEERRATFLEDQVAELLKEAFPGSVIFKNVKWKDGNQIFETDVLAVVGSYLIIAEAKSGAVSWSALRGAPDRTKKHIKELLIDPSIQSKRLEIKIRSVREGSGKADFFMEDIGIDFHSIWEVVRLSVTLEDFATIQSNIVQLQHTGWLPDDFDPAPTLSVADLETVLSVLPSVTERLFYFIRRYEMERNIKYHGDEMDLLGYYLEDGFSLPFGATDETLMLNGMSQAIDAVMTAKYAGSPFRPLRRKFTKWWADVIAQVESSKPPRYSELAVMLCGMSYKAQKALEKETKTLKHHVLAGMTDSMCNDARILMPDRCRTDAFAVVVMNDTSREDRISKMQNIAYDAFDESAAKRCLVLVLDAVKKRYPYQTLGVFERKEVPS